VAALPSGKGGTSLAVDSALFLFPHERSGRSYAPRMDENEARGLVQAELADLRRASYAQLVERLLDKQETFERLGATGARYAVEIQAMWDGKPQGNLRVMASIDDGGLRSFVPLSDDFIRAPDGSFVGE